MKTAEILKTWEGVPFWQIETPEYAGAEADAWEARNAANLRRFITHPKDRYTIEEAAELLAIDPALVLMEVCERDARRAAQYLEGFQRHITSEDLFVTAVRIGHWTVHTVTDAFGPQAVQR